MASIISDTSFSLEADMQKFKQELKSFMGKTVASAEQTKNVLKMNLDQRRGNQALGTH